MLYKVISSIMLIFLTLNISAQTEFEKHLKSGNIGYIKFKSTNKKKLKVLTIDGYGKEVVYMINQSYWGLDENGKIKLYAATPEVLIGPLPNGLILPFQIYKSTSLSGDQLVWNSNQSGHIPVQVGTTLELEFTCGGFFTGSNLTHKFNR
jgi:hypothetical protein